MADIAMLRSVVAVAIVAAVMVGCPPICADHRLAAVANPAIVARDVDTMLTVTFTGDVLTSADASQFLVVRLAPPNNAQAIAIWSGGMLSSGAGLADVMFSDARTMHVTVHIDHANPAGDYSLEITTQGTDNCLGPNGNVTLRVQ